MMLTPRNVDVTWLLEPPHSACRWPRATWYWSGKRHARRDAVWTGGCGLRCKTLSEGHQIQLEERFAISTVARDGSGVVALAEARSHFVVGVGGG